MNWVLDSEVYHAFHRQGQAAHCLPASCPSDFHGASVAAPPTISRSSSGLADLESAGRTKSARLSTEGKGRAVTAMSTLFAAARNHARSRAGSVLGAVAEEAKLFVGHLRVPAVTQNPEAPKPQRAARRVPRQTEHHRLRLSRGFVVNTSNCSTTRAMVAFWRSECHGLGSFEHCFGSCRSVDKGTGMGGHFKIMN